LIADFHLHSHYSDGRLGPAELVDVVADAGVDVFALTDHDTLAGHTAARLRSEERGVHFVPGIEMTTFAHGHVVHILGLGLADGPGLQSANVAAERVWDENQCRWVAALANEEICVQLERDFPDHPVRLPILIERLCRLGCEGGDPTKVYARFRAFFASLPAHAYRKLLSPSAAAAVIRESGGIAILAHPLSLHEAGLAERILPDCDGLEAEYAAYGQAQWAALRELARRQGKLTCGGSDYHGYFEAAYQVPKFTASRELMDRLMIPRE
jgi:3',5'-nucleoside bisphosphate phosphatase